MAACDRKNQTGFYGKDDINRNKFSNENKGVVPSVLMSLVKTLVRLYISPSGLPGLKGVHRN